MAGTKSNYLENAFLNWLLAGSALSQPGTVWVGLWTATLDDTSTGATAGEVSGSAYARVAKACNSTNFGSASGGTVSNATLIDFGTAAASWGTVTHLAILDAATNGNILYHADLTASKVIGASDPVTIPIGDRDVSEG